MGLGGPDDIEDGKSVTSPTDESFAVPWYAYVPASLLIIGMWIAWIGLRGVEGMTGWAVSSLALSQGRYETIALHMFAHGGLLHILMNSLVLFQISGPLMTKLGYGVESWIRFGVLFLLSGLSGMVLFLIIHPSGEVPMLGASGAIYGLLGLLLRVQTHDGSLEPLNSPEMRNAMKGFLKDNLILFLLLTIPALLQGQSGGVAWEAHLGGFIFGLLVAPYLFAYKPALLAE